LTFETTVRCGARATGLAYARRACGHGDIGIGPHKIVTATLTLFQPEGADYAHHILMYPPSFESHRRACNVLTYCVRLSVKSLPMSIANGK